MPGISVIVTVYNKAAYLAECLDSVLGQTLADLEVIVVDDGSTDESGAICDACAERDARVRVIHKANGGVRSATLAGVAAATAPLCGFVDGDDVIRPDMYEKLHAVLAQTGADGVCCGMAAFEGTVAEPWLCVAKQGERDRAERGRGDRREPEGTPQVYRGDAQADVYDRAAIERDFLVPFFEKTAALPDSWSASRCDKLYRTALLAQVCEKLDKTMFHREDYEVNLRYLALCGSVAAIAEPLYRYRRLEGSFTRGFSAGYVQRCQHSAGVLRALAAEQDRPGRAMAGLYKKDLRLGYYVLWEGQMPHAEKLKGAALLVRALLQNKARPTRETSAPPRGPAKGLLWLAGTISYGGYWLYRLAVKGLVAVYHALRRG